MSHPSHNLSIERRPTRQIRVGSLAVGGGAPVSVQTMTKTDTRDVAATVAQIHEVEMFGCDLVRLAVVDGEAADALGVIRDQVHVPLIADIHFDHRLALTALESGVDGLRLNPGNIGSEAKVQEVVSAARERRVPIRIGVNAGSLEKDILDQYGPTPEALVESALRHVGWLERFGYEEIKISVKASDVGRTVSAYRLLSERTDYPLHLGVTEAGTLLAGTARSCAALGILLAEGIGDTLRISLTDQPSREVAVGLELLRALGLREGGASVVSCPTCGRCRVDVMTIAGQVETAMLALQRDEPGPPMPVVAVMGCMVNGPGEAREADVALAGGEGKFALYERGNFVEAVPEDQAVPALVAHVRAWRSTGHA